MNKSIFLVIIGLLMISGYLFLTDDTFRNIFKAKKEPTNMIDQNNEHGGEHQVSTVQSQRSYEMEVKSNLADVTPNKPVRLIYKIKNDKGEVVKNFDFVHEKIMHFITIRHDLQYFQHLHPDFNQETGEFSLDFIYPADGPYRLFPDFTPTDENPQKLPVTVSHDVEVGNMNNYKDEEVIPDTQASKSIDRYSIVFSLPSALKAQEEMTYSLNMSRNGTPITNLETYLGALGHSVILREGSLDFIHTHALDKTEMGPKIEFTTTFPEAGVYKIFTQFQHQEKIITTDYIVNVN